MEIYLILPMELILVLTAEIEIPAHSTNDQIVNHKYYTLKYNEDREQSDWVAYSLSDAMIKQGRAKRSNRFKADPYVSTGSATLSDYKKSGYDRGHLCPAAAMRISPIAMKESFYLSNMSPQEPGFNRGIWKKLEAKVRKWAIKNKKIYVVTGPIFYSGEKHKEIGPNGVDVPDAYFKAILDFRKPDIKAIAFILPNSKTNLPISSFAVSVDKAEEVTGIDFFSEVPDYIENDIEAKANYNKWK
ncbi:MAG TPA: DNA/RNA non-specific endonuclease [Victivallales bacterium]|nr:DNA/RNA non-specific endonuclease [Victivallales bacterium]